VLPTVFGVSEEASALGDGLAKEIAIPGLLEVGPLLEEFDRTLHARRTREPGIRGQVRGTEVLRTGIGSTPIGRVSLT
jgi:hypothetical protein